jgi:hypothetical protein
VILSLATPGKKRDDELLIRLLQHPQDSSILPSRPQVLGQDVTQL